MLPRLSVSVRLEILLPSPPQRGLPTLLNLRIRVRLGILLPSPPLCRRPRPMLPRLSASVRLEILPPSPPLRRRPRPMLPRLSVSVRLGTPPRALMGTRRQPRRNFISVLQIQMENFGISVLKGLGTCVESL